LFTKIFSRDQAALASVLLLGQQSASFSKELKTGMKQWYHALSSVFRNNIAIVNSGFVWPDYICVSRKNRFWLW
jgi:hypothetical protein